MFDKIFKAALISVACLATASCCEKKIYCSTGKLDFAFAGYTRQEIRSFTLRRYAEGDQWGAVIDSAQFVYYGDQPLSTIPDTFYFSEYRTVGKLSAITPGNDWGIYVPTTGRVYFITAIVDDQHNDEFVRCNDKKTTCTKEVAHFLINDQWRNGNFIYIDK